MLSMWPLVGLTILLAAAGAQEALVVTGAERLPGEWRSKFHRVEADEATFDGAVLPVMRLRHDLSQEPSYDWVRYLLEQPVDLRPYGYLSFRIRGGGEATLQPMLMQLTDQTPATPHGEIVVSTDSRVMILDVDEWRLVSIPLAAFGGLERIADGVDVINFGLRQVRGEAGPAELAIADVAFTVEPRGEVVPEQVPYPPADIAIVDEAEFFGLLDLARPELAAVKRAVDAGDWTAAKAAWGEHLATRTSPRWVWSRDDKAAIQQTLDDHFGGLDRYVPRAETVLQRDFNWLGVRKQLEHDIDWLQGPVEWTHVLSRHAYWKDLAYAYWATGDEKYAEDWVFMLRDWIADNPVPRLLTNARGERGTVWRTLETGIRGDVWFDIMNLFMDAPAFDAEAKYLMTASLVEHARHLHRYTVAYRDGNWQVVEATGLAAIGIMLPEFREAADWRERAFEYLRLHMERDVYPDGAHSELTPGYHSWVMERFLQAARLAQLNGYEVPGLLERHERMFEFLMKVSRPNRRFWSLGDAGGTGGGSIQAWMGVGALLYNRPDMRWLAIDEPSAGWVWLFGPDVVERYAALPEQPPAFASSLLPDAQYAVMRTGWEPDDPALLFDAAPWGGGHSHQDRLQVLLWAGRDLLLDPGMYSYDQPLSRTYFRESEAHNVLLVDEAPQPTSDPELLAWTPSDTADFAAAEITGAGGLRQRRSVLFIKPSYAIVVDHVFGEGEHDLTRLWHLPQVQVGMGDHWARTAFGDGANVHVQVLDGAEATLREGWLPTGGATAEKAPVLAFVGRRALPATLATLLVPFADAGQVPEATVLPSDEPTTVALRVVHADGRADEVRIGLDGARVLRGGDVVWQAGLGLEAR